jgi:hypothetical protein
MIGDPAQLMAETNQEDEMTLTADKLNSGVDRDESSVCEVSQGESAHVYGALPTAF